MWTVLVNLVCVSCLASRITTQKSATGSEVLWFELFQDCLVLKVTLTVNQTEK